MMSTFSEEFPGIVSAACDGTIVTLWDDEPLMIVRFVNALTEQVDALKYRAETAEEELVECKAATEDELTIRRDAYLFQLSITLQREEEIRKLKAELAAMREQLISATDLGNKRWEALNSIYENAEKRSADWCRRQAKEGLGLKGGEG